MNEEKHVLVLFYDSKDMTRTVKPGRTLADDITEGFKETNVKHTMRTASPRHEPWLALEYFNENKYDGIVVVAGMSCSLDVPHQLMDQLYDNQKLHLKPRDWQRAEFEKKDAGKTKYRVNIDDIIDSKYHGQERPVPIIGVPTKDSITDGENALFSMLMLSRPSSGACVGIEQGYSAAKCISKLITTPWDEVLIVASDTKVVTPASKSEEEILSSVHKVARDISQTLDKAFRAYDDAKIPYGYHSVSDFEWAFRSDSQSSLGIGKKPFYICVYDNLADLKRISNMWSNDPVIGVYVPRTKVNFSDFAKAIEPFENVVHTRIAIAENAAIVAAHALYGANPKLATSRFTFLRRNKSEQNVEKFLELWQEKGKSFEIQ